MKQIIFLLFITCTFNLQAQLIEDDSYLDADFGKFKAKLTLAIENRDSLALSELMADTIFGVLDDCGIGGCSKEVFFQYIFDVQHDDNWIELGRIVRFGFKRKWLRHPFGTDTIQKQVFQAPSYLDKFNYESTLAILGTEVNIRESLSVNAKIIRTLSFDTLSCNCGVNNMTNDSFKEADNISWVKVELPNGKPGYVAQSLTSMDIGTEITVLKINGKWKIWSISPTVFC